MEFHISVHRILKQLYANSSFKDELEWKECWWSTCLTAWLKGCLKAVAGEREIGDHWERDPTGLGYQLFVEEES